MSNSKKETYVIGICNTEADGVTIKKVKGTLFQIKRYMMSLIKNDRDEDSDSFDYGTERIDELEIANNEINGYNVFSNYHIDYTAVPENSITNKEL